ncbi:g5886 [Coccomyxa elongata]
MITVRRTATSRVWFIATVVCLAAATADRVNARLSPVSEDVAPAPAPLDATAAVADLLFILSAAKATFVTPDSLRFDNISSTIQFYSAGARTGIMAPPFFLNGTLAAPYVNKQGQWLSSPQAVLYGISGSQYRNVLVSLDSPAYDSATKVVTFAVSVIDPNVTTLRLSHGAASEVAAEYNSDTGLDSLLTSAQPGTEFTDAALFIDVNKQSLVTTAHLKDATISTSGWGLSWGGIGFTCTWGFSCGFTFGR